MALPASMTTARASGRRTSSSIALRHCLFSASGGAPEIFAQGHPRALPRPKVQGVRVFIDCMPATGKDEARFTAQFPKSEVTLDVDLTIAPDDRPNR